MENCTNGVLTTEGSFTPGADAEHPHAVHGEGGVVPHGVQVPEVLFADVACDVLAADKKKRHNGRKIRKIIDVAQEKKRSRCM